MVTGETTFAAFLAADARNFLAAHRTGGEFLGGATRVVKGRVSLEYVERADEIEVSRSCLARLAFFGVFFAKW